jgi:Uma2 family endonuclease
LSIVTEEAVFPFPRVKLIESDGEPLESDWHVRAIQLLIDVVSYHLRGRDDFYCGGNMFIYYSEKQARNRDYRGPDFFFVQGVPRLPMRPYWAVWDEEGRYPDVIIELLSATTAKVDRTTKKDIYEKTFHTHEYYCYDPDAQRLEGWRLINHRYEPIAPNDQGWLWCEELGLWLGPWEGKFQDNPATWLRFYDAAGKLGPTFAEGAQDEAEAERQRAEAERQRAEAERQRAEAAEAELAQLRAALAEKEQAGPAAGGAEGA